jgi:DNA-binding MarR family transcriptional regulator
MKPKKADGARFRTNIPFLMNQIVTRVRAEWTEEFEGLGFNVRSARVLIVALQNPGSHIGRLAEITTLEMSTLSHMLARMEREGLLERRREGEDTRFVSIHLTPEGRRMALDCLNASNERERRMLKGLTAEEVTTLRRLLSTVFENVRGQEWEEQVELGEAATRKTGSKRTSSRSAAVRRASS